MRIFKDVDMVEQLGSGMSRILKTYDESVFYFTPNFMIVTLPFAQGFISPSGEINGEINGQRNMDAVLFELEKNPGAKLTEIANATALSERTITRLLKELKASGKIRRVGSNKKGYWEIIEDEK